MIFGIEDDINPKNDILFTLPPDLEKIDAKMKNIMFDLFDKYEEFDDIKDDLRSLHSSSKITDAEYDRALEMWTKWVKEWSATK